MGALFPNRFNPMQWPRNPLGNALGALETHYGPQALPLPTDPFAMVLWEQVAYLAGDEKRLAAFEALRSNVGTDAASVARARKATLVEIAALGGIFAELRAGRMQKSAAMVVEDFAGDLTKIFSLPDARAKKALMRFPMI